jgi:hypothetical protein
MRMGRWIRLSRMCFGNADEGFAQALNEQCDSRAVLFVTPAIMHVTMHMLLAQRSSL